MTIVITGVAGFIGSNLAKRLLDLGETVIGIDNLSRGVTENLFDAIKSPNFNLLVHDLTDVDGLIQKLSDYPSTDITAAWHLAANSDISFGNVSLDLDLKDTFMSTIAFLRLVEFLDVNNIFFASTSAVYGDAGDIAIGENFGPLLPISNYGAMKLASEAVISAATDRNSYSTCIFRFPNVVGIPATHGVIYDFIKKLIANPKSLNVLGDGTQKKVYVHVDELIDAMLYIANAVAGQKINIVNIGPLDDGATVKFIATSVVSEVSPSATISYGLDNKGWVGDVPTFKYSIAKLVNLGWRPILTSEQAITKAITQIKNQLINGN